MNLQSELERENRLLLRRHAPRQVFATPRQVAFLRTLVAKRVFTTEDTGWAPEVLVEQLAKPFVAIQRADASRLIDRLKDCPEKATQGNVGASITPRQKQYMAGLLESRNIPLALVIRAERATTKAEASVVIGLLLAQQ